MYKNITILLIIILLIILLIDFTKMYVDNKQLKENYIIPSITELPINNNKNVNIIFTGYDAYGDWISLNSFVRFLLNYYNNVILITEYKDFVKELFRDNNKIIIGFDNYKINSNEYYDEINIEIWVKTEKNFNFTRNFFSTTNPIAPFLGLNYKKINTFDVLVDINNRKVFKDEYKNLESNSSAFYIALGIPKEIKLDYFYFKRNIIAEEEFFNKLQLNNKNYIIINDYYPNIINKEYYENKNFVNINNISKIYDIFKVIENAEEVHLIENSIALFIYHMQYKNLIKSVKINFHAYARKENFRQAYSLEESNVFLDMFLYPKLENWNFIFN